jgi:hypothetical protein
MLGGAQAGDYFIGFLAAISLSNAFEDRRNSQGAIEKSSVALWRIVPASGTALRRNMLCLD